MGVVRKEASAMPAPIILSSIISSWTILWVVPACGAVAVIVITTLFALATGGHAHRRQRHGAPSSPSAHDAQSDEHALV